MDPKKAKSVSARLLKTGKTKIWIDPQNMPKVREAITKEDVRALIAEGIIKKSKQNLKSRHFREGKKKKRKTGPGKKKGTKKARVKPKKLWMRNVRAQRKKLREVFEKNRKIPYRKAYSMIKGGFFKGKKHLESFLAGGKK